MGVPKFFRYICHRYPCLQEVLNDYQMPEFDNLYLDMNGIIHCCSHPNDADAHFRTTEEEILKNIFQYLEILFNMIKPQKLFFMAIDGVAPRAKINQQRGRRFRTAKETEAVEARARARGEEISKDAKFDSNCITPGTVFMSRLSEQLKYFITWKISTNELWKKCKIILSGPEVPGEGEYKIMDYIRFMKAQPDYDPNTRHCLYGLDADLIILSLCTHEPNFTVLREEVKYGKRQKKCASPEKTKFCLLYISLLREYLEHEFSTLKDKISFPFDLEKIIDDWILMVFLVGNDFIPHLPNLHIDSGALAALHLAYMEILPSFDGYINEAGTLKLDRFEKFMEKLSQGETDHFADHLADLKYFESKTGRRPNETERTNYRRSKDSPESFASPKKSANKELSALIQSTVDMLIGHSDEEDLDGDSDAEMNKIEFLQHKRDYYMNKLEYEDVDAEVLRSQAEAYVTAIQWNLHYYYDGCCSWSWYYPHHYAPYISDIKNFKDFKIEFSLDEPFLPFQQLLAVLPAASKSLLPEAYQGLVSDEKSPIIDYYPEDFKVDLNQKKHDWEAIVLIPFINEKRLLDAMEPCNDKLTAEEQKRNKHGPMCVITYTEDDMGMYEAPQYYPSVQSHAKIQLVNPKDIEVAKEKLVKGLSKGVRLDLYVPGFPTFQHIKHETKLKTGKVKVFEHLSRGENMIISILPSEIPNLHDVAGKMLGKTVFVRWPYLREARVIGVSTSNRKITLINAQQGYSPENVHIEDLNLNLASQWHLQCNSASNTYMTRYGIDVGDTSVLLYALPMVGKQYLSTGSGKMSLDKVWAKNPVLFVYQAVVTEIAISDSYDVLHRDIADIYTVKSVVFMLGHPLYGAMGEVINPGVNIKTGRVKVAMRINVEPNLDSIRQEYTHLEAQWMSTNMVAQRLGVSTYLLNRLTGSIYINEISPEASDNSQHNIGLNLKFNKRNEQVPGYTKKSCGQWWYSTKSIATIRNYTQRYPTLMKRLTERVMNEVFNKADLFEEGSEKLEDVLAWLKERPSTNIETQSCDCTGLDPDTIAKITNLIDKFVESKQNDTGKTVLMQVKPHLLFKPGFHSGNLVPDPVAQHKLFDRIITVKESSTVPLGYKGTIIEIENCDNTSDKVYDVLFDRQLVGGISFGGTTNRRARRHDVDFINISHGIRSEADIASNASGVGQAPAPPKSWRQDHGNSKKQSQSNANPPTSHNQRTIFFPTFGQNSKNANTDPPQLRVMKKNEGQTNRSSQSFGKQKTEPKQNPSETRARKTAPEVQEIKSVPLNAQMPRADGKSEFQMLWNELHKPPAMSTAIFSKRPMMQQGMAQPEKICLPPSNDSLQDESAFLKAMLKISDENSSTSSKSTISSASKPMISTGPANASTAPPLVQQLFDHARQASRKENVSYCAMLLTHSQLTGIGMPRYNYLSNQQKMVCAQILLPDMRVYCGEFSINHEQAAESAAKVVCKELRLESVAKPGLSILGAPPAMWLNHVQNDVPPPSHEARPPPMMPPQSPQVFPNMHSPPMHIPQWNLRMQRPPAFPHPPHPTLNHNIPPTQNTTQPVQSIQERNAKKSGNKNKKSTPFVPLQAQKKTRNPKPKQTPRNQNQTSKDTNTPQVTQIKPKDDPPKVPEEKTSGNEKKDSEPIKSPQTPQKVQRPPKQRRSRIAANFNSGPPANGGAPQ